MPGIVGVFSNTANRDDIFNRMVKSLMHERYYKIDKFSQDNFSCGRVHFGIFNPELQPIFNKEKSLCIFMDGKIYGYEKTKRDLEKKGYQFKTKSDAEFCLYLFEEKGEGFVKELNGDFFICICDLKNKSLYLFNDRFGLRPHYYTLKKGKLLFAPEAKAILQDKSFKKEINPIGIADFFSFGYMLNEETLFRNIKLLPPASIFLYTRGKLKKTRYWDFEYTPDYSIKPKEFADRLVLEFKKAVQIRTREKLKYGVSLSGGLDSRAVLAAIKKNNVIAYTFGDINSDEVKIAKKVAEKNGNKIVTLGIDPKQILEYSTKLVYLIEAMDYIGVSYITFIHSKLKGRLDVSLEGLALDLTLGGSYLNKNILNLKGKKELIEHYYHKKRIFSDQELNDLFLPKCAESQIRLVRK
jgi:asparagine synthase (glutamine-hydrolysing)